MREELFYILSRLMFDERHGVRIEAALFSALPTCINTVKPQAP